MMGLDARYSGEKRNVHACELRGLLGKSSLHDRG